jgi:hypothetical protein
VTRAGAVTGTVRRRPQPGRLTQAGSLSRRRGGPSSVSDSDGATASIESQRRFTSGAGPSGLWTVITPADPSAGRRRHGAFRDYLNAHQRFRCRYCSGKIALFYGSHCSVQSKISSLKFSHVVGVEHGWPCLPTMLRDESKDIQVNAIALLLNIGNWSTSFVGDFLIVTLYLTCRNCRKCKSEDLRPKKSSKGKGRA